MIERDVLNVLSHCTPFQDTPVDHLHTLLPNLRRHELPTRGFLWHQGDQATDLCFVITGHLHSIIATAGGEQIVTQVIGPGESFGEPALFLDGGVRLTAITAISPCTVLTLAREPLLRFLEQHPEAMRRMLEGMSRMILNQCYLYRQTAFHDIRGRVAYQLLKLADEYGTRADDGRTVIPFTISQTTLAGLVAGTRESVNRALSSLSDRGVVRQDHGRLVIDSREGLQQILVDAEG